MGDGMPMKGGDIEKLRTDVFKQAQASLSAFIGTVRYGSSVDASAAIQSKPGQPQHPSIGGMENLYDVAKLQNAVEHANSICHRYGISIISINIISAVPIDKAAVGYLGAELRS